MIKSAIVLLAGGLAASAHVTVSTKITWSKEISRIVYQRCLSCHREGGQAPFSLETYAESRPWAKAIQEEVLSRRMPPWGALKGFGEFSHDAGLSQDEVTLIAEWAEGGAPEGDPTLLPSVPWKFDAPPAPDGSPLALPAVLKKSTLLTALRTDRPTQVTALLPDGSVQPLLWVITALKQPQTYLLAKPMLLPAGTQIRSPNAVTAWVTETKPERQTGGSSQGRPGQTAPKPSANPGAEK